MLILQINFQYQIQTGLLSFHYRSALTCFGFRLKQFKLFVGVSWQYRRMRDVFAEGDTVI
jgi:hypothetical protein